MPIRRIDKTLTATTATIAGEDIAASSIPVKPHIQPGVLQPAVAGKLLNGANHSGAYGTAQTQSGGDGHSYYYTDIKGSKPIKDPRIGAHFGSQRHIFSSVQKLEQETATHGVQVFSIDGRENMRCVSNNTAHYNNQHSASYIQSAFTDAEFYEITGYFNDINMHGLTWNASSYGVKYSINGASYTTASSANDFNTAQNSPLINRYIRNGSLLNLPVSATLGINTVKISMGGAAIGIELIAQDTTSTATKSKIQIPAQNVVSYGKKFALSAAAHHYNPFAQSQTGAAVTINSSTTNTAKLAGGWSGTGATYYSSELDTATSLGLSAWVSSSEYYRPVNGGRVVWWVNSEGALKCSVNMMPPAGTAAGGVTSGHNVPTGVHNWATKYQPALHSTTIDHSQAEVAKTFHWREFGNGAANAGTTSDYADASMLNTTTDDIGYVMDDGLTTLTGDNVRAASTQQLIPNANGDGSYVTFIGTGISTIHAVNNSAAPVTHVAQNLPYGTHILKVLRDDNAHPDYMIDGISIADVSDSSQGTYEEVTFYQPKMPPVPEDACIIADYMLMADFVRQSATGADIEDQISKGVRWQSASRDVFHDNAGGAFSGYGSHGVRGNNSRGLRVHNGNGASTAKLPFFGTTAAYHVESTENAGVTATLGGSSTTKTALDNTGADGASGDAMTISNTVTLGSTNTVLTYTAAYNFYGIDIVTPIHTSSHYQTFETPFLHELVGGDRNMEQNNLIVTSDGKSWGEVTRDTSYIGNVVLNANTNTAYGAGAVVIFDDWRGKHRHQGANWFNKDFAIAYDKVICLVDGEYQIYCASNSDQAVGPEILLGIFDGSQWGIIQTGYDESSPSMVCHLKRGDYVKIEGLLDGNHDRNQYYIVRLS